MIIRKYKKGDEKKILLLDRIVETHPWNRRNLKNWFWKYKGCNPFGKSMVWVAEEKNKIVATFAAIPMDFRLKKKIIKGACSIAMIVHPTYQNKGLIKFVADKLFNEVKDRKIKFIYGYPNYLAYEIHKIFFNYDDVSLQKLFLKKINSLKTFKNNYIVESISRFNVKIDRFLKKISSQKLLYLNRSSKFLNWRYLSRPDKKYYAFQFLSSKKIISGYVILKLYQDANVKRGHIIDLMYDSKGPEIFNQILNFSYNFFYKKGCKEITLWLQGDVSGEKILRKHSYTIQSKRPMICKFIDVNKKDKKIMIQKNWYFTMGDTLEIY